MTDDEFRGNRLPPFPVDDQTLDMLWDAMHPWEKNPDAERSSLSDFLTMMDTLGGSDPEAIEEVLETNWDGTPHMMTMRDQSYHHMDVISALIVEVRRLRTEHDDALKVVKAAEAWLAMLDQMQNRSAYNRPIERALIAALDTWRQSEGET